jgi:hypothetical protein
VDKVFEKQTMILKNSIFKLTEKKVRLHERKVRYFGASDVDNVRRALI